MAKGKEVKLYDHLNDYLITAYQANYRVLCVLQQMYNAEQVNVSSFTEQWFKSKHNAYAEHRYGIVSQNQEGLRKEVEHYSKDLEESKTALANELKKYFADKKFEDVFYDATIMDSEVVDLYNQQAMGEMINETTQQPETGIVERFMDYLQKNANSKLVKTTQAVHDNIISDISWQGYKNLMSFKNETDDVKIVEQDFVAEFYNFAKLIGPSYKKQLLKAKLDLTKLYKQLNKNPNNLELASQIDSTEYAIQFCEQTYKNSEYLLFVANVLNNRMKAVNDRKYDLSDKIVEGIADFGFMVPSVSKGEENRPKFNTMYVGANELENLISVTKEFPEAGMFTQYLSSKLGVATVIPAQDFELGKLTMDMLREMHESNVSNIVNTSKLNGEPVTVHQAKVMATKPEVAKFLQFETPLGRVWFDGENCVNVKTGEAVLFNEVCKYVLNPTDGKLYYLQTDKEVKPGGVTLVNDNPNAQNTPGGKGKE